MRIINLRDYYPSLYSKDYLIHVPDEVAEVFLNSKRAEDAYLQRKRRYKAYYSLDADHYLESEILKSEPSPMELYEQKHLHATLYQAMKSLSDKQYRRLSAHIFQKMSIAEIARVEGVSKASVQDSIEQALKIISKILTEK